VLQKKKKERKKKEKKSKARKVSSDLEHVIVCRVSGEVVIPEA
jgi:hypothetical protein